MLFEINNIPNYLNVSGINITQTLLCLRPITKKIYCYIKMVYKARNACGTIFVDHGIFSSLIERLRGFSRIKYAVFGEESCPTTGRCHLQYYLEFSAPIRRDTFHKLVGIKCDFAARKGTAGDASNYCKKGLQSHEEWDQLKHLGPNFGRLAVYHEWGELSSQGKRTDIETLRDRIKDGLTEREIIEQFPSLHIRYYKAIQRWIELLCPADETSSYSLESCSARIGLAPVDFDSLQGRQRSIILSGPSGIGKTQFALAHFNRPKLVSHVDDLKHFVPGHHDGIVFDDVDFRHHPRTSQIMVTDWELTRSIHCRHVCAVIPKHTNRIFCCNIGCEPVNLWDDAISSRVVLINI